MTATEIAVADIDIDTDEEDPPELPGCYRNRPVPAPAPPAPPAPPLPEFPDDLPGAVAAEKAAFAEWLDALAAQMAARERGEGDHEAATARRWYAQRVHEAACKNLRKVRLRDAGPDIDDIIV